MTTLLLVSFIAGILTIFAPCLFPLLPVIIGGSLDNKGGNGLRGALIVIGSLVVSIVLFTLLIKFSSDLLGISRDFWVSFSAVLIILVGIFFLYENAWHKVPFVNKIFSKSNQFIGSGAQKGGTVGKIVIGASLAPAFSSCSPTYFLILATILPANFFQGVTYLFAYSVGLGAVLLLVALLGQVFTEKLEFFAGQKFKKIMGIILIVIGLLLFTGLYRNVESFILDLGVFNTYLIEERLIEDLGDSVQ